jgi:hypothetical protein
MPGPTTSEWKAYRTGPLPVWRRGPNAYCWSCRPRDLHQHRWYVTAWLCWWLTTRRFARIGLWLLLILSGLGTAAAWLEHGPAPPLVPVATTVAPAQEEAPRAQSPPPPLTPVQAACLLQRLRGGPSCSPTP